jgi:cytoskeletal protein RodZ
MIKIKRMKKYGWIIAIMAFICLWYAAPLCFAETIPSIIENNETQTQQTEKTPAQIESTPQQTTNTTTTNESNNKTTTSPQFDMTDGIPLVTTDQAAAKFSRITGELHSLLFKIAPMITVVVLVIGGLLFFFVKAARVAVFWAIIGLILVTWSIPIVGYILKLANA